MWVQAGFPPDDFWQQTPRLFQLAMKGVRKRLEQEFDGRIQLAWQVGAFGAAAQAGKLKPLKHYLRKSTRQSPQEMLAVLRSFQARGAGMTFTRFERGGS